MSAHCDAEQRLRGAIGFVDCGREPGHEGMHRDNCENLWWYPGAELESARIPDRTNRSEETR